MKDLTGNEKEVTLDELDSAAGGVPDIHGADDTNREDVPLVDLNSILLLIFGWRREATYESLIRIH